MVERAGAATLVADPRRAATDDTLDVAAFGLPEPRRGIVNVLGTEVVWATWPGAQPALLFVHGGGGHAGWWMELVGEMVGSRSLTVMDLSGHGDSGRRPRYSVEEYAQEICAVGAAACDAPPVVVAHSMGARPTVIAAATNPDAIAALVLVEALIPTQDVERSPVTGPIRRYPDKESAAARFRLHPGWTSAEPAVLQRLGSASVRRTSDGWTWKFDPLSFAVIDDRAAVDTRLRAVACDVRVVHGAMAPMTSPAQHPQLERALGRPAPYIVVPDAGHHLMLDQPRALAEILATAG